MPEYCDSHGLLSYELDEDDKALLTRLQKHVAANPRLYVAAGEVLDADYSVAKWRRQQAERLRQDRRASPEALRHVRRGRPRSKFRPPTKWVLFLDAANNLLESKLEFHTMRREKRIARAARVVLLMWLAAEPDADRHEPRFTLLQEWPWEFGETGGTDGLVPRRCAYALLKGNSAKRWLQLVREALPVVEAGAVVADAPHVPAPLAPAQAMANPSVRPLDHIRAEVSRQFAHLAQRLRDFRDWHPGAHGRVPQDEHNEVCGELAIVCYRQLADKVPGFTSACLRAEFPWYAIVESIRTNPRFAGRLPGNPLITKEEETFPGPVVLPVTSGIQPVAVARRRTVKREYWTWGPGESERRISNDIETLECLSELARPAAGQSEAAGAIGPAAVVQIHVNGDLNATVAGGIKVPVSASGQMQNGAAASGTARPAGSKPQPRPRRQEFEAAIMAHLHRRPHDTAKEVAGAVQCSVGVVSESRAWKLNQARLRIAVQERTDPTAISLTDERLKVITADGATKVRQTHAERAREQELADLTDEQIGSQGDQVRAYREQYPDASAEEVSRELSIPVMDVVACLRAMRPKARPLPKP